MTKEGFQVLCSDVIFPYIEELMKLDSASGSNCLKIKERRISQIYRNYEAKRKVIRRFFMKLEEKPMDRHKIGSVFMYSILKSRVLKVTKLDKQTIPHKLLMANEYLAVYVALSIVESYRIDENGYTGETGFEKFCLIMPETFKSSDTYVDNLCKALYYLRNGKEFDIFAYANILFLLEAYTNKCQELRTESLDLGE